MFNPVVASVNPSVSTTEFGHDGTLHIAAHILSRNHCTFLTSLENCTGHSLRKVTVRFQDNPSEEVVPFLSHLLREAPPVATYCVALLEARRPVQQPTMGGFRGW